MGSASRYLYDQAMKLLYRLSQREGERLGELLMPLKPKADKGVLFTL